MFPVKPTPFRLIANAAWSIMVSDAVFTFKGTSSKSTGTPPNQTSVGHVATRCVGPMDKESWAAEDAQDASSCLQTTAGLHALSLIMRLLAHVPHAEKVRLNMRMQ